MRTNMDRTNKMYYINEFMNQIDIKIFFISGFCELTTEFQVFMIKYKDIFYEAFNKIQYENAMKLQNKIRRFIKSLKESNYASFKKVHNQLKPLHGHPKNKHLLSEIEESMKTELKLLSDNISIGLIPLKV